MERARPDAPAGSGGVGGLVPAYRLRPSPLHAAGAGAGAAFCGAIAVVAVLFGHPLVLGAALLAVVVAAAGAGVLAELRGAARNAAVFGLLVAVVNPIVTGNGLTVLIRDGDSVLGVRLHDITLEAVVYGGVAGLRIAVLFLAFALFSAAVDPDEVLRGFRRISHRSALTAALATRLGPVLARDAARLGEGARCRPVPPPRRAVLRATLAGALDRAVEVAAALEVRGYATAVRPPRIARRRSRHDLRVGVAAALVAAVAIGARVAGVAAFTPYPRLELSLGPAEAGLAAAIVALAALPFAGAAARLGVARG